MCFHARTRSVLFVSGTGPAAGAKCSQGVWQLTTSLIDSLARLLAEPLAGIILGIVLAVGLFRLSKSSFARITPEASVEGLLFVSISLFARLAFATLALWGYKSISPDGFMPFALSLAGGFLVLFGFETVRYGGLLKGLSARAGAAKGGR